ETVENTRLLLQQRMVYLIDHHEYRLFTAAQHIGNGIIQIGNTGGDIYHKEDNRGLFNGNHHLLADSRSKHIIRTVHVAARVDYRKGVTRPFALAVMPVARYAAEIVDYRPPAFCQPVVQRRFTDIWPSYYCDDVCHKPTKVRIRNGKRISLPAVALKYRPHKPGHWPAAVLYSAHQGCPWLSSDGRPYRRERCG